ncbi:unnamed protein product [Scytosiphon promiscuus]
MKPPIAMDLDDFAVVLNSDSESVLLKGLRRFARQIRLEHGLIAERDAKHRSENDGPPHEEAGDAEAEAATAMEVDSSDGDSRSSGSDAEEGDAEGASGDDGYAAALAEAAGKGEPPGLLGEYLRGSPQLNDLLRLWDLDERKSSPLLAAAHTDSFAAVLECLAVVLRHLAKASAVTGALSAVARGEAVEATGLGLCRRLTREKLDELHAQLSTQPAAAGGSKKDKKKKTEGAGAMAAGSLTGEEGAAATLRLLASMARFHR